MYVHYGEAQLKFWSNLKKFSVARINFDMKPTTWVNTVYLKTFAKHHAAAFREKVEGPVTD